MERVTVQPSPASCANHACMDERYMQAMSGTPIQPQTEAATAADSLRRRRSVGESEDHTMPFYDDLTNFIFVDDAPKPSDVIFVPGGAYGEIAEHAAALYHQGYAPLILVSGKYSILDGHFAGAVSPQAYTENPYQTECEFLTDVLLRNHVPRQAIWQETQASYTYENAIFSKKLTDEKGLSVKTAILSCQAYHARRCLLYFQLLYPDTRFLVCPAVTRGVSRSAWHQDAQSIDLVLGEVERCGSQFHNILKNCLKSDTIP